MRPKRMTMDDPLDRPPAGGGSPSLLKSRVDGQGEPLLLLNGGLMSMAAWQPVAAVLRERFRVVRCDFRGQLLSPGVAPPSLDVHVGHVVDLLDALELGRVHLAGTSFGGLVATRLAALHPQRAASLSAIAATDHITPEVREMTRNVRRLALAAAAGEDGGRLLDFMTPWMHSAAFRAEQTEVLQFQRLWVSALPEIWFRGIAALFEAVEEIDLRPDLGAIRCPALVLAAEEDSTFPVERSRALAAGIPGARLEVVPGGHGIVIENPGLVARSLLAFLAGSTRSS